ncbi:MAG TPA: beta-galactosidase [Solirubrobacterales bacterium]|nr:beta-galactosidase [Solirubrobacterales bacterium]
MKRSLAAALLLVCLLVALVAGTQPGAAKAPPRPPKGFFGVAPQSVLTEADVRYMKAGGIEAVRWPLPWEQIQPLPNGPYDWEAFDQVVSVAARQGMQVLPFVYATPKWISRKYTKMPIDSARARQAWVAFLEAAVKRYGPGGEFWAERAPGVVKYEPAIATPVPIRNWQVWNEANFFYFAYPVSPQRFVRLLKISSPAIKRVDPGAKVILSGLFGEPTATGKRGMPATEFLDAVYRAGTKRFFDGIALHPYAAFSEDLEEMVEELHKVTLANRDRVPLYITEMGWGSQNNFKQVAFEQGVRGQVEQLKASYGYLLENRSRLNLKQVYWFSWKDLRGSCSFCDSVGLFKAGARFKPKPAWHAFVSLTGGRARP